MEPPEESGGCRSVPRQEYVRALALVTIAQLGLTSAVHNVSCERRFSVQNNILTPLRNRLTVYVQHRLIRVKLGPERELNDALEKWRKGKTGGTMGSDLRIRF